VGRLAGGVAHDFNNLLTIINGYCEIALDLLDPNHDAAGYLHEIKAAGDRAAGLTRQLLTFSRNQVVAPQVLNLNLVVSNVEKMLVRLIGEDVKLRTTLDPNLGWVKADPGQLEQVIMNLAVNARDAMLSGGNLTIETSNVELDQVYARDHAMVQPGSYVMLAVSDTGVGMSQETQTRIFEPFFTTKDKGKGTGLGLATTFGIVQQSGGHIWVYSELGQGTVVKVYFPLVEHRQTDMVLQGVEVPVTSGTETIMVVEDEKSVQSLIRLALASAGYKVLEMGNAESALAACAQYDGPIDLLLTDVVMPGMSGRLVAQKVTDLRPRVKVLYMSGYTDDAIVHHGVLSEGMPFIQKPFSPLTLRKKIREVLGANGATRDLRDLGKPTAGQNPV
jgi:two-component system cell cycle sensor histidine kinase/response regulator CckA